MSDLDFSFKIDVDTWQRQLRRKHFILLKKFRDRMKRFTDITHALVSQTIPVGVSGNLKNALRVLVVQENMTQGIFTYNIFIDEKMAPYAKYVNTGRGAGRSPYAKIREWVQKKLGLSGKDAHWRTKAIQWKFLSRGFDGHFAPYHFMKKAEGYLSNSVVRKLMYELELDIKEVFASNGL